MDFSELYTQGTDLFCHINSVMTLQAWFDIIKALFLLGSCVLIGKILKRNLRKLRTSTSHNALFLSLAATIIKTVCNCIGILLFLGALGINIAFIIKTLAVFGVGLGYLFKDPVSDIAAGFFIATYKPLGLNTEITVNVDKGMYTGKIRSIELRYITLENKEQTILVPNSFLFKQPLCIWKTIAPAPTKLHD